MDLSDLPPMDVEPRCDALRASLGEANCEALLVSSLLNIRYLTGFTGTAAMLLVTSTGALFTTDGRYGLQAEQQLRDAGVDIEVVVGPYAKQREALAQFASNSKRLGLEAQTVTWAEKDSYEKTWFPGNQLVATNRLVETLRLVKDSGEIARLERACQIADQALATVKASLSDRTTEQQFAFDLDLEMRRLGSEEVSFPTIVAAGANGAMAHHEPSDHVIERGELVVIDFGAVVDGYHSDMTRTLCAGEPAGEDLQVMFDLVLRSQQAGVDAVHAGVPAGEVDSVCREVIATSPWSETFTHSTGHGVGLEVHEYPIVSLSVTDTLVANQVVTVEPGVYVAGRGGVRIEDTVVVTDEGCVTLTRAPKDLVIA